MKQFEGSIPLTDAKIITKNWRDYYQGTYNAYVDEHENKHLKHIEPNEIFRGFRVGLTSLESLKTIIDTVNNAPDVLNPIVAIRVYLAKGHPTPTKANTTESDVHVLLVPVTKDGKDMLQLPEELTTDSSSTSTILDYTTPCPANCDTTSALY